MGWIRGEVGVGVWVDAGYGGDGGGGGGGVRADVWLGMRVSWGWMGVGWGWESATPFRAAPISWEANYLELQ